MTKNLKPPMVGALFFQGRCVRRPSDGVTKKLAGLARSTLNPRPTLWGQFIHGREQSLRTIHLTRLPPETRVINQAASSHRPSALLPRRLNHSYTLVLYQ